MNAKIEFAVSDQIALLMERHGVKTRDKLRLKLGLSKNTIRNWEISGRVPDKYLRTARRPVQLVCALAVLRDVELTDEEARKGALFFLSQLEGVRG